MSFALQQQAEQGVSIAAEDVEEVQAAGRALLASLDNFIALAPSAAVLQYGQVDASK